MPLFSLLTSVSTGNNIGIIWELYRASIYVGILSGFICLLGRGMENGNIFYRIGMFWGNIPIFPTKNQ